MSPIRLLLKPSVSVAAYLLIMHTLSLSAVYIASIHAGVKLALFVAVFVHLAWCAFWFVSPFGDRVSELVLMADERWMVVTRQRAGVMSELLPVGFVQPWLTVLRFRLDDGRRRSVVLTQDNVAADPFRRLRVRLRFPIDATRR